MVGLFFLFQRHAAQPPRSSAFALFIPCIAEFFVITFKSTPIQPGDLSAISTAAAVAGNRLHLLHLAVLCAVHGLHRHRHAAMRVRRPGGYCTGRRAPPAPSACCSPTCWWGCCGVGGATVSTSTLIDYYNTLGITVYTWRPLESYWREGYLPAFISAAQSIKPPKPADYSVDDAKATLIKYAKAYDKSDAAKSDERAAAKEQFDSEKPDGHRHYEPDVLGSVDLPEHAPRLRGSAGFREPVQLPQPRQALRERLRRRHRQYRV
ncbi:MAG: hypothetical protein V8Q95_07110 [Collinsella sp.]